MKSTKFSLDFLRGGTELIATKEFDSIEDAIKFYNALPNSEKAEFSMWGWDNPRKFQKAINKIETT